MKTQRIIKFRVWDEKYRCWVNNSFLLYPKEEIKIQGRILTQFTGLLDKNSKEIYEGDIVKFKLNDEFVGVVVWFYNGWIFKNNDLSPRKEFPAFDVCNGNKPEIIGNIFENLELLNEKI